MESKPSQEQRIALVGRIFTSDLKNKWAETIVFEKDTILFVGNQQDSQQYLTPSTQIIQLDKDFLVLPGFIDTHMHPLAAGLALSGCPLETCCSLKELQKKIKEHLALKPDSEWIFASGYIDPMFPEGQPHRKYLDEICPDKPLIVMRFDCHSYLTNTKTLEKLGITKETEAPFGGIIEKDKEGNLTGVFHELAMNLLKPHFPRRNQDDFDEGFNTAKRIMFSEGITGCNDASVKHYRYTAYNQIFSKPNEVLPRTSLSIYWGKELQEQVDKVMTEKGKFSLAELVGIPERENYLRVKCVKFFLDGVMESKTALLEEPYLNSEKEAYYGIQNFEEEYLKKYVVILHSQGIQCHFHAIGDKAIRIALDAIEHAKKENKWPLDNDPRHYIAHCQLINPKDYQRFKDLNVAANFSPVWCWFDTNVVVTDTYLGPQRAKVQYPIKDLWNAGVVVTFGSDWPVSSHRPLDGIETAVTRKEVGDSNREGKGWCEEQKLTVEEAVLAYTINSAYVSHQEKETGSLEKGKKADIIVLNQNIFECEPWVINETRVKLTVLDGKVIHNTIDKLHI